VGELCISGSPRVMGPSPPWNEQCQPAGDAAICFSIASPWSKPIAERPVPILTGSAGFFAAEWRRERACAIVMPGCFLPLGERFGWWRRGASSKGSSRSPLQRIISWAGGTGTRLCRAGLHRELQSNGHGCRFLTPFGIYNERLYRVDPQSPACSDDFSDGSGSGNE